MELRERIIKEIKTFGERSANNCKKAEGLYRKHSVIIDVPLRDSHIRFWSEEEAMRYLMKNAEEIRHHLRKIRKKREMKMEAQGFNDFGDHFIIDTGEIKRKYNEEEWEYQQRKRRQLEKEMSYLIHTNHFEWNDSAFEDMTSQALMNLLVALKQSED